MTQLLERPILPTPHEAELAGVASRSLSRAKTAELRVQLDSGEVLLLPRSVNTLLYNLLTEMAQGNAVTLIPVHAELTTQEAADYLNVSRPYLIGLLNQAKIPHHMTGTHRRVKFSDLQAYRQATEDQRQKTMQELAAQAQALGMGY
jgi:excisionase family DNA binding protein